MGCTASRYASRAHYSPPPPPQEQHEGDEPAKTVQATESSGKVLQRQGSSASALSESAVPELRDFTSVTSAAAAQQSTHTPANDRGSRQVSECSSAASHASPPRPRSIARRPSSGFFPSFSELNRELTIKNVSAFNAQQKIVLEAPPEEEGTASVSMETSVGMFSEESETKEADIETLEPIEADYPGPVVEAPLQDVVQDCVVDIVGHRIVFSDERADEVITGKEEYLEHLCHVHKVIGGTTQQETLFIEVFYAPVRGLTAAKKTWKGSIGPFKDESCLGDFEVGTHEVTFDENQVPDSMMSRGSYRGEVQFVDCNGRVLWRHTHRFEIVRPTKKR